MQYRKGICVCHNEERLIVKRHPRLGNFCQQGNQARLEAEKAPKANRPLKRTRKKPTGEAALFKAIWASRPRVSFLTGQLLPGSDARSWFFAHVLPKRDTGGYLKFKLYIKTIADRNVLETV